jgi:hypothetical protein
VVYRLDSEISAHLVKQSLAELLLQILDGCALGSEIDDPVAAAAPARIHVERYVALAG